MRRTFPSSESSSWRITDNNVPEYIRVQAEQMVRNEMEENVPAMELTTASSSPSFGVSFGTVTYNTNTYENFRVTQSGDTILTTASTSSSTPIEVTRSVADRARQILEQMSEMHSGVPTIEETIQMYQEAASMEAPEEDLVDDSEFAEEPVVRRRVTRKKKEKPMFWKEPTLGTLPTLPALLGHFSASITRSEQDNTNVGNSSSAFVNLIPMKLVTDFHYVIARYWHSTGMQNRENYYRRNLSSSDEVNLALNIQSQNTGLSQIVNNDILSGRISGLRHTSSVHILELAVNSYIQENELYDITHTTNSATGFHYTERAFRDGQSFRIHARTFSVSLGQLTCFLETERYSRVYTPQIMAVILPENYVYQKEHILLYGTIDLSKVVVLVNRELDNTDFHNKNFRAYYRKYLLPILNSLKVDIWKVPVSFMEENCFHKGITLEKTSFMERKAEMESIYTDFRDQFSHIDLDSRDDDDDESDDDYDEEYHDEDDDDY